MSDRFSACLTETLRWEGGYSDDPHDSGGKTMRGVIQRVYDGYRDGKGLPRQWVKLIEDAELREIYRNNYWRLVRGDELPAGVDLVLWDMGVNAGPSRAIRLMQRVLGVKVDGHIGPATMAAITRQSEGAMVIDLIRTYTEERRRFYRSLKVFWRFGKGWLRRADGIEAVALEMARPAGAPVTLVAAAAPLPDADAQSASQAKAPTEAPKPPWITEIATSITGVVTKVAGLSTAFGKWSAKPAATSAEVALFFLAEPLVIAGIVMLFGAFTTYLWRRRVETQ